MPENGKLTVPVRAPGPQRSRRLRATTCAAGIVAAGIGLAYVLTGNARAIDIVFIAGGLLAILASLVLMRQP